MVRLVQVSPLQSPPTSAPADDIGKAGPPLPALPPLPVPAPPESLPIPTFRPYLSPSEVTTPPHVLSPVELVMEDEEAADSGPIRGTARLVIYVGESGRADKVEIESSTLPAAVTDRAIQRFSDANYAPATLSQTPVRAWLRVELWAE